MEGWSNSRDGSSLHEIQTVQEHIGGAFDLDFTTEECRFHTSKERLRGLFDQVLVAFMREKTVRKCVRPIPALCGDGRLVDLYKLFWLVRKIGGYEAVSRNNIWGFVAEECGLGFGDIPSVKLIYFKYLNELEQWLRQICRDKDLESGKGGVLQKLDSLSRELETRFGGLMLDAREKQEKDDNVSRSEYLKDVKDMNLNNGNKEEYPLVINRISESVDDVEFFNNGNDKFCINCDNGFPLLAQQAIGMVSCEMHDGSDRNIADNDNVVVSVKKVGNVYKPAYKTVDDEDERLPDKDNNEGPSAKKVFEEVIREVHNFLDNTTDEDKKFGDQNGHKVVTSAKSVIGTELGSRKRKREFRSFTRMLNWLIHVAKHSDDPAIGKIPECSKWKDHGHEELWVQALLVRESLLIRRCADRNADESLQQGKQNKGSIHPSMYEETIPNHQSTGKLRCSKRLSCLTMPHLSSCCNSCEASPSNVISHHKAELESGLKEPIAVTTNSSDPSDDLVFVGPLFQAEIPEWTGVLCESDSKWLGTQMWPMKDGKKKSIVGLDPIGRGRQCLCNCLFPDSVECIRFHIAEKRLKLKSELGLSFYHWRFDRMGEEISLSWTKEEEQKFKDMMRTHAAFPKRFWNNAFRFLPSKTREQLISYYFNVFLVQRRSYQSRVSPNDIDSDDDEKKCGSIGESFGYKAISIPCSRSIMCHQNNEHTDFV